MATRARAPAAGTRAGGKSARAPRTAREQRAITAHDARAARNAAARAREQGAKWPAIKGEAPGGTPQPLIAGAGGWV
ncbi:hypothetical protein Pa4123_84650 [Phytohabitans aurantiacus]|uniref:Uncharacterized protein n=1 Tax=Phytohabitans aurantiacus TaxID=3016789 RepID=A0ABQ5RAL5_9ACTN|nr:hypothetical protein Pa4123_84650 [Phytohabitans aurantiacus]